MAVLHAGSPEGERMELFDRREEGEAGRCGGGGVGVTLQPPSTPCAWAHSVMKWPVSWRPCPNNGPIQLGEESLSRPGWIRYLWFRSAVPLSLDRTIFYSVYCSSYRPPLLSLRFTAPSWFFVFYPLSPAPEDVRPQKTRTKKSKHTMFSCVFTRYHVSWFTCLGRTSSMFPLKPFRFNVPLDYISCV